MIALITGGAGCGKSTYAERVIDSLPRENRVYIATMRVCDEESAIRVQRHRHIRAHRGFETVEAPLNIAQSPIAEGCIELLEDIPNLVANEMFIGGDWTRVIPGVEYLAKRCRHLVIVTNDVFSDGVKYPPSIDQYLRNLAWANSALAKMADCAVEVVYSIPIALKGELPCT